MKQLRILVSFVSIRGSSWDVLYNLREQHVAVGVPSSGVKAPFEWFRYTLLGVTQPCGSGDAPLSRSRCSLISACNRVALALSTATIVV